MARDDEPIEQHFRVDYGYRVHFTEDLLNPDNPLLAEVLLPASSGPQASALFVLDDGVLAHHQDLPERIRAYCHRRQSMAPAAAGPVVVPGGEGVKNRGDFVAEIHDAIHRANLDRHSYVVAIGGGAVLDTTGYAAATAHRGIRLVRVPTTALAQNDAGIGVKNGINAFGKKNFLGTFAPPFAVINDARFLETLDDRAWRSGIAEAVKVALLKDVQFFAFLEGAAAPLRDRSGEAMRYLIRRCAELHLEHIATCGDPFEMGSSRPLDFGHWSAHKLESLSGYQLAHGEGVAIGIALDITYCRLAGLLAESPWRRILSLLRDCGFVLFAPELKSRLDEPEHADSILHGLREFREHLGGRLTLMLLRDIGEGVEVNEVDYGLMREAVELLEQTERSSVEPVKSR